MPVNAALVAVNKALSLVDWAILVVRLALNDNPAPDDAIKLNDLLADLQTLRDRLDAQRTQLNSSGQTIPPPEPALISEVQSLTARVQAATHAGATVSARLAVAGEALTLTTRVMTHFG